MKKISTVQAFILTSILVVPIVASAADPTQGFNTIGGLVTTFNNSIVKALITLFATGAMAAFFFGIVQFIWGSREGDATKAKNGKNFMVWGVIALFVMFSVWGIVQYAQNVFGIQGQSTIVIPSIQIQSGGSNNQNPSTYTPPTVTPECTSSNNGAVCGAGANRGQCENSVCVPDAYQI